MCVCVCVCVCVLFFFLSIFSKSAGDFWEMKEECQYAISKMTDLKIAITQTHSCLLHSY